MRALMEKYENRSERKGFTSFNILTMSQYPLFFQCLKFFINKSLDLPKIGKLLLFNNKIKFLTSLNLLQTCFSTGNTLITLKFTLSIN